MKKSLILTITLSVGLLLSVLFFRFGFYTFVENYELAYKFDKVTGKIEVLTNKDGSFKQGYLYSPPFIVSIHTVDMRPVQVCLTDDFTSTSSPSSGSRVLNCKLVKFEKVGLLQFIEWHGRGDFSKYDLQTLLKIYAYDQSPSDYRFLTILKELKDENIKNNSKKDTILSE